MPNALAKKTTEAIPANAQLHLPIGVKLGASSLEIPQTLSDSEVMELGSTLRGIHNASAWWVADYIVFAQEIFLGKKKPKRDFYDKIAQLWPSYARATLQTMASIARRVPAKIRSPVLSFDHHSHVATLFEENQAEQLQAHYIRMAEKTEANAEQLRLMIADTKRGVAMEKPKRGRPHRVIEIEANTSTDRSTGSHPSNQADDGLPIPKPAEPELMTGSHAQLASDAQRALARLRDWYDSRGRKEKPETWSDERKQALIHDLQPVMKQVDRLVDIIGILTAAGEGVQADG